MQGSMSHLCKSKPGALMATEQPRFPFKSKLAKDAEGSQWCSNERAGHVQGTCHVLSYLCDFSVFAELSC